MAIHSKREMLATWQQARAELREAQFKVESAELDAVQFLVQTNQTHLLKVNWSRFARDAQNER